MKLKFVVAACMVMIGAADQVSAQPCCMNYAHWIVNHQTVLRYEFSGNLSLLSSVPLTVSMQAIAGHQKFAEGDESAIGTLCQTALLGMCGEDEFHLSPPTGEAVDLLDGGLVLGPLEEQACVASAFAQASFTAANGFTALRTTTGYKRVMLKANSTGDLIYQQLDFDIGNAAAPFAISWVGALDGEEVAVRVSNRLVVDSFSDLDCGAWMPISPLRRVRSVTFKLYGSSVTVPMTFAGAIVADTDGEIHRSGFFADGAFEPQYVNGQLVSEAYDFVVGTVQATANGALTLSVTSEDFDLDSADSDGDGFVTCSDRIVFFGSFGATIGDPEFNARCDIVLDGEVNASDYFAFLEHFLPDLPCPADLNCDGTTTGDEFDQFIVWFYADDLQADVDLDGYITGTDFDVFVASFYAGCP